MSENQVHRSVGDKVKHGAATVGKGAAAAASIGAAAYVGGAVAIGTASRKKMEKSIGSLEGDLTHLLTNAMGMSGTETCIANKGHGACETTAHRNRRLPVVPSGGNQGPDNDMEY